MKKDRLYLAYFDNLGFECVLDMTNYEQKAMWSVLGGKEPPKIPLQQMILRAKMNPQRFPEIYSFWSELDLETLISYTKDNPQGFADLLREKGNPVFVTPKQKEVIK